MPIITTSVFRRFFFGSPRLSTMSAVAIQKVQAIIDQNPVAVFSKSYCPYCRAAKQTLTNEGVTFYVIELNQVADGGDIQEALAAINGQRTVPNIYINKQHIGGNSELQAIKPQLEGKLAGTA